MSKLSRALVDVTKLASPVTVASLFSPEAAKQNAIAEQKAPVDFTPISNLSDPKTAAAAPHELAGGVLGGAMGYNKARDQGATTLQALKPAAMGALLGVGAGRVGGLVLEGHAAKKALEAGKELTKKAYVQHIALIDELSKLNAVADYQLTAMLAKQASSSPKIELSGLGLLAAPSIDQLQAHARAGIAGDKDPDAVTKRQFLPDVAHPIAEVSGLGLLAAPDLKKLIAKHAGESHNSISEEDVLSAVDRLEHLDKVKPTLGTVGRFAGLGAVTAPGIAMSRDLVAGNKQFHGWNRKAHGLSLAKGSKLRNAAGVATGGALAGGVLPLVQNELSRRSEKGKIRKFLAQSVVDNK